MGGGEGMELLQWWNLIFVLPFVGALMYILLLAFGVVSVDHDVAADFGPDVDLDHDVDIDVDHDVGIEHSVGHEIGAHEPGAFLRALSFLGVGRVPISIIIVSFCFIWGFVGWVCNSIFSSTYLPGFGFVWISLIIAMFLSVSFTKLVARVMSKIMPSTETYAISESEFVGRIAETVTGVDENFGQANINDKLGNLHTLSCRVRAGEKPIPRGTEVVLMYYKRADRIFFVSSEKSLAKKPGQ